MMSVAPPGAKPTTTRTGFTGQVCAWASMQHQLLSAMNAPVRARLKKKGMKILCAENRECEL